MAVTAIHLVIHGRVQGVGFRSWLERTARAHNLNGWVRNLAGGTVEAALQGELTNIQAVVAECESGPQAANVLRIERTAYSGPDLADFTQLETAA